MAKPEQLGVWLDGVHVADLTQQRWPAIRCRYSEDALARWPRNSPVLSCSLPLQPRPQDALAFCKGLLPEGQALQAVAANAGLAVNDTFELLGRYGRDVAGALVIAAEEPEERRFGIEPYTVESLERALDEIEEYPLGAHDDSELSLAGLQDKLLLIERDGGGWGRPLRGRPSTHILKLDDPRHPGLVEAEALCLELGRAAGLTTVEHRLETIGPYRCLIVSRFDRIGAGHGVRRVHQEDLCQALAIDPDENRRRAKYESGGGPSLRRAARLLDSYAGDPEAQLDRLTAIVTFTVLTGNADAHGKNLAFLHPSAERIELAPLYDTVPTALWPKLRSDAAMGVGGQVSLPDVTLADIVREAVAWNHPAERAAAVAETTVVAVLQAIDDERIPPRSNVAEFVRTRARQLGAKP
jgi:serine/threonine-protein kinase HipA